MAFFTFLDNETAFFIKKEYADLTNTRKIKWLSLCFTH